ncbi:conserved hypothetical protein [Desulfamplus magnetovallimortis]|uniref:Uncharacterized protein n=1 Tax=Desulfamplus magnetovallimortis TaxID=1246637 RepID=A0A1W1HFC3_9BACT|nr:hypothetical protein [Desulfamplus magnetovallimortis]SLM31123.1 conserved hypothetical protein [Desulfamplus magnetovallimortis]
MGGFGSGRRKSGKAKPVVENQISLKIKDLKEYKPETVFYYELAKDLSCYSATVTVKKDHLLIHINCNRKIYDQTVEIKTDRCNLGGLRQWMICPECSSKRTALYLGKQNKFACRKCLDLGYSSQKKVPFERLLHNAESLRARADQPPLFNPLIKPKGMHTSSFNRLRKRIYEYEIESHDLFKQWAYSAINKREFA